MKISAKLRERFCKDCKIPISVFEEPYFTDRLQLYDKLYDSMSKWQLFVQEINKYDNEQDYLEEYNRVKDMAISDIKESVSYQEFNNEDMNKFAVTHKNMPGKDIFKPSFDGMYFISVDIKKANFNCLRHYNKEMLGGAETWEEFIRRYTDNEHIISSKYIRQVILGNCNPKRHITYEKHLMDEVLTELVSKEVDIEDIVFFSNDEIVIQVKDTNDPKTLAQELASNIRDNFEYWEIPLRVEAFQLHKIGGLNSYYKESVEGSIEFKCIDGFMLPFVLRKLYKQDITDSDRVFFYEGLKAQVIDIPNIEL